MVLLFLPMANKNKLKSPKYYNTNRKFYLPRTSDKFYQVVMSYVPIRVQDSFQRKDITHKL